MKAVVFDLDDTLLHDDLTISDYSVDIFQRLKQKGFAVIAASGRTQYSMRPYVDQLNCLSVYIACNGGEIWDGISHRLLHQEMFSTDMAVSIARFAELHSCYAHIYDQNCFFFNQYGIYADRYAAATRLNGIYVGKLSQYIHKPLNKILMIDCASKISLLYSEATAMFSQHASVTCSKPSYLEFTPLNATKGHALEYVSSYLGIDLHEFIAFGDSLNDLSMLKAAGCSVCVSNGWHDICLRCDEICLSNNEDGPAHYMDRHYLHGEV